MSFWPSLICNTVLSSIFLHWAQQETDAQIGRMQDAAYDTPGAQSPLPASVLVGAGLLAAGQIGLAQRLWRLSGGQALALLLLGAGAAALLRVVWSGEKK